MVLTGPSSQCRFMGKVVLAPSASNKGTSKDEQAHSGQPEEAGMRGWTPEMTLLPHTISFNDSQPWVVIRGTNIQKYMFTQI